MDSSIQQQFRTERVVRMEVQRRQAKGALRVIDNMIREVDDQLMYVSQFKKEWLQHQRKCEEKRQEVVQEEMKVRTQLLSEEDEEVAKLLRLAGCKVSRRKR